MGRALGVIGGMAVLIARQTPGWPVVMLPMGILLVLLFILLHEVSHDSLLPTHRLNTEVAGLSGTILRARF